MSVRRFIFTIVLAPSLLLGQLPSSTVTVTASQNSISQPDQAIFNVSVGSEIYRSLNDVVNSVASVGISAANLKGASYSAPSDSSSSVSGPPFEWWFELSVALSSLKQTTTSLAALQNTIAQAGGSLSFSLSGTQSSGMQAQACDFAGLIANAQAQAQATAAAAGSAVGRITGISSSISQGVGNCSAAVTFGLGYSGNPGPHTISVTASCSANSVPDQVVIGISLSSSLTAGLDDVAGALSQAGITGATFSGVYSGYTYDANPTPFLAWSFTLTAPLANLGNAFAQIAAAQAAISKQNSGMSMSFSSASPRTSPQAQPVCAQPALIGDATMQAQALAIAAGVSMGPIAAISSMPATPVPGVIATSPANVVSGLGTFGAFVASPLTAPTASCSLLVQFQVY
jgi:uncharacterized protein YggE